MVVDRRDSLGSAQPNGTLELTRATSRGMCVARCFPAINAGAVRPLSLRTLAAALAASPHPSPRTSQ